MRTATDAVFICDGKKRGKREGIQTFVVSKSTKINEKSANVVAVIVGKQCVTGTCTCNSWNRNGDTRRAAKRHRADGIQVWGNTQKIKKETGQTYSKDVLVKLIVYQMSLRQRHRAAVARNRRAAPRQNAHPASRRRRVTHEARALRPLPRARVQWRRRWPRMSVQRTTEQARPEQRLNRKGETLQT